MNLQRTVVVGNCGAGKTFLANALAAKLNLKFIQFDDYYWKIPGIERRPNEIVLPEILELSQTERWVMEGVLGELAETALPRATALIFLNFSWEDCKESILKRGKGSLPTEIFEEMIEWSADYHQRQTPNSLFAHQKFFMEFLGDKFEITNRKGTEKFLSALNS